MYKIRKEKWYEWEEIALNYYIDKWYKLVIQNWTIPWWEIDLILENNDKLLFVEVKNIIYVDDIYDYITPRKLQTVKKSIDTYIWKTPTDKLVAFDVVFVKNGKVYEVYEDVEV